MSKWSKSILLYAALFCAISYWTVRAEPAQHGAAPAAGSVPERAKNGGSQDGAADAMVSRASLDKYCVGCHNSRTKAGGLTLDAADAGHIDRAPELWEKVVRKLRDRAMPPAGAPRPDAAGYDSLAGYFETRLDAAQPNAGRPVVRRLNRVEYTHAIRDLLALDVDGAALLPADESGYGFDNIGDVLSVSPALLERYMFAAQKISTLAVGDPAMKPVVTTYRISQAVRQDRRMSDELPFRSRGGAAIRHYFPVDGDYALKLRLRRAFSNAGIIGYNSRERLEVRVDDEQVKLFAIGGECAGPKAHEPQCVIPPGVQTSSEYSIHLDDALDARVHVKAGEHLIGASFAQENSASPEGVGRGGGFGGSMALDRIVVEGPTKVDGVGETASRNRIFACRPARGSEQVACADKILSALARRAYRRPVTRPEVAKLVAFFKDARSSGTFDEGIRFALERLLVSPNFLLRVEHDQANATPGTSYRVSDLELASRLSFFLWSTIPDDELLDVAAAGRLSDEKTLEQQVRRMLADSRSTELVSDFASQWLYLRDLKKLVPDPARFPEFTDNLREAFLRETQMFLENEMRGNQPVPHLLTADYTFANEELARFYGIPNVYGTHFRRVQVPDSNRSGLLGHGSVLTVTSYATRTSPVQRGKYILANILGTPPPPPPPNVPALPDLAEGGAPASMRDRMAAHRRNPVCASCHVRMDPLGFALENFDAIGRWRTTSEAGTPIDASASLPDGTRFEGVAGLRKLAVAHRADFARTFAEKLLMYATGRGLEYYDMPAVRQILRDAAAGDYRWSTIVLGIVKSPAFQMRRSES